MKVTLYSSSSSLTYEVDSEQSYYKKFFSDLKEATGTTPDRLEVPEYVLEQYPAWAAFITAQTGEPMSTHASRLTYLADVRYIIGYLIELPSTLYVCLAADDRQTLEEKRAHFLLTGRLLRSHKKYTRVKKVEACTWLISFSALHASSLWKKNLGKFSGDITGLYNDPVRLAMTVEKFERALSIEWISIAVGLTNNSRLLSSAQCWEDDYRYYQGIVDLVGVDWSQLDREQQHSYEKAMHNALSISGPPPTSFYFYARRKLPEGTVPILSECEQGLSHDPDSIKLIVKLEKSVLTASFFHSFGSMIHCMTDERGVFILPPPECGLEMLLTGGSYGSHSKDYYPSMACDSIYSVSIWNLIGIRIALSLAQVPFSKQEVTRLTGLVLQEEDFLPAATHLVSQLGLETLVALLASLKHYVPGDSKAMSFCRAVSGLVV